MTPEPRWVCRRPRLDERCRGPQAASEPPQKHGRPCTDGAVTSCARWQNFLGRLGDEWMANAHKSSLEVRSKPPGQLIERTSRRHCRRQSARSASMKKCSPSARQRSGIRDDTARKGRGRRKTPARQCDGRREAFPESRSRHKKASPFARKGAHGAPQSSSFRSVRTMRPSPTAISRCSFRVWPYHQHCAPLVWEHARACATFKAARFGRKLPAWKGVPRGWAFVVEPLRYPLFRSHPYRFGPNSGRAACSIARGDWGEPVVDVSPRGRKTVRREAIPAASPCQGAAVRRPRLIRPRGREYIPWSPARHLRIPGGYGRSTLSRPKLDGRPRPPWDRIRTLGAQQMDRYFKQRCDRDAERL
jgi:hypothetical protein